MKRLIWHLGTIGRLLLIALCSLGFALPGVAAVEITQALEHLTIEGQARRGVRQWERYLANLCRK